MSASLSGVFNLQEFTDPGAVGVGMRLYTLVSGTATFKAAYTDAAGSLPHTYTADGLGGQYIALNARGELPAPLFLAPGGYDLSLRRADGSTVWTRPAAGSSDAAVAISAAATAALTANLNSTTDAAQGAGISGYDGILNYAVGTIGWHGRSYESVLDHFSQSEAADFVGGAPTLDHTAAFNRATRSTLLFTGNADSPKRRIDVPPGNYNVAGPVYVRKGQSLCGAGGATRILQNNSLNNALFIMGKGLIAGVETTDPGGLPVVISDIHIESASATYPAIDTGGASGWTVRNAFITNAGLGISVSGGDGIIDGCTFDQGLVGVSFANCQNIVLSNCIFYLGNFQMRFQSNCYDVQMDNMHFEYPQFASILFDDGATSIVNVKVSDSLFVMNAQYSTFTGFVYSRSGDFNAEITSSTFRNMNGYAYQHATGIGGTLAFSDCTFDGRKTNPAYAQSTTAGGIQMMNETVSLKDCRFLNLTQAAVSFSGGFAGRLDMDGGEYSSIGATQAVLLTSTSGGSYARITNVRGDSACPLLNAQGVHSVKLKGNIDWLGQLATAAGRSYFRIPFCGDPLMTSVTIAANTNPTGDARYRRSSKFVISKATDFNGGAISDSLFKVSVAADATDGVSPVIDLQVDIGSVGNGIHVPHTTFGGYIYASVPSTYTAITITADFD